jgi:hypothetical protein
MAALRLKTDNSGAERRQNGKLKKEEGRKAEERRQQAEKAFSE